MKKKKIFIADDDEAILDALTLMLEEAGYEVENTANGETVKDIKKNLPDLLLLDLWMSGIDGRDICKYLKKHEPTKHLPIIIISARKDAAEIAKEAGANDFIAKPFDMDDLLEKIARQVVG